MEHGKSKEENLAGGGSDSDVLRIVGHCGCSQRHALSRLTMSSEDIAKPFFCAGATLRSSWAMAGAPNIMGQHNGSLFPTLYSGGHLIQVDLSLT